MKTKKISTMLSSLFMLASFILIVSCNKDNENNNAPILLSYENNIIFDNESRHYSITPFIEATTPLYIKGGDGHYTVNNLNKEIINVDYNGKTIQFKPISLGSAIVAIKDNSGNQYDLTVEVRYHQQNYVIASKTCVVEGNNMTVGEKTELENKVKSLPPVERYEFTYTNKEDTKGSVRLYSQKSGSAVDYKEYSFEQESIDTTIIVNDQNVRSLYRITMKTEKESIKFYVAMYFDGTKSIGGDMVLKRYYFIQDLTERYKGDYPAMENVYEIQIAIWKRM
ncbi:MAG: hypothetical protein RSA53_03810 [Odoribacter sp.]